MPQQDDYNSRSRSLMVVAGSDDGWSLAPGEPGMPRPGDLISGKYRIEQMVGRGGMGAVFRATHVLMDKPVAVKWMTPELGDHEEARERFAREARAAARIRHPNVVDVYDVGTQGRALYMVMELLEGESFEGLVARGDIPIPQLLQLLIQAMRGVAAAHAQGIIHRDIKPDNIFIIPDATQRTGRTAKVLDFGISKLGEEQPGKAGLTKSGMTMGTPAYMSLEQMNGARDVDARADVYSFGVLLYRALTGVLPFDGETFGAIAVAIATHHAPSPRQLRPELPQALDQIVMRAMARNRHQRFASLQELIGALESLPDQAGTRGQLTPAASTAPVLTPVSHERPRVEIERPVFFETEYEHQPAASGHGGLWIVLALCLIGVGYGAWRWISHQVEARDPDVLQQAPAVAAPEPPGTPSSAATPPSAKAAPHTLPAPPPAPAPVPSTERGSMEAAEGPAAPVEPQAGSDAAGVDEPADDAPAASAPVGATAAEPEPLSTAAPEAPKKRSKRARRPERARTESAPEALPPPVDPEIEGPLPDKEPAPPTTGSTEDDGAEASEAPAGAPAEGDEDETDEPADESSWHRSGGFRLEDL